MSVNIKILAAFPQFQALTLVRLLPSRYPRIRWDYIRQSIMTFRLVKASRKSSNPVYSLIFQPPPPSHFFLFPPWLFFVSKVRSLFLTVQILLILLPWCPLPCPSLPCISHELIGLQIQRMWYSFLTSSLPSFREEGDRYKRHKLLHRWYIYISSIQYFFSECC